MSLSNSHIRYGVIAKLFHWSTALLILALLPVGLIANAMPFDTSEELARKAWVFSLHKTLGLAVFALALARILWALTQIKPGGLHPDRRLESWAAETVHWLLYAMLVLVPLSGWIHHAATTGFAPIWWPFGQSLPFVPKSETLAGITAGLHHVFIYLLVLSLGLHVAGALKHHVTDRDATLKRMWFGHTEIPQATGDHKIAIPLITALAVLATALFIGNSLNFFKSHSHEHSGPSLAEVQSDWQVQSGTLGIVVSQLGSDVRGSFADWTAAISFDDTVQSGQAGTVDVTIAIGSLTLGSVTSQALGTDYFDATTFPTARFTADILHHNDGYAAQGTLTIKDQATPLTLPFTLQITDGIASMQGSTTLDRRAFGIGSNQQDSGTLGFEVQVEISLTAQQQS